MTYGPCPIFWVNRENIIIELYSATVHCTLHYILQAAQHCTLQTAQYTLHCTVHCTLYAAHLPALQSTLHNRIHTTVYRDLYAAHYYIVLCIMEYYLLCRCKNLGKQLHGQSLPALSWNKLDFNVLLCPEYYLKKKK